MKTPSQCAQIIYRPRCFINHLLTYLLLLPTGIVVVVSLYLKCTFKSDTNRWTDTSTHQRILPTTTIRHDVVYLMCRKKLTCSQLSPPHGTNRRIKEKRCLKINPENWLIIALPSLKIAGYLHGLNAFPMLYKYNILSAYSVFWVYWRLWACDHSSVSHCSRYR